MRRTSFKRRSPEWKTLTRSHGNTAEDSIWHRHALAQRQGALLATLSPWYTPDEVLVMATGNHAELLAMSGKRNPYPGKLGVVEEGALADLLLLDGDPLANIELIGDPVRNFVVIMKDGRIYKNTLEK